MKKSINIVILIFLLSFNKLIDANYFKLIASGLVFSCLVETPFYFDACKKRELVSEIRGMKEKDIYSYLIKFFSTEHDGYKFIKSIQNNNNTKILIEYLEIAANRVESSGNKSKKICDVIEYSVISTLFFSFFLYLLYN